MQLSKSHRKPYVLPELSDVFWAYLAGFIDGEGHIRRYYVRTTSNGKNYGYEMSIAQNRENNGEEVFNWIRDSLNVGHIRLREFEERDKDVFYFHISQRMALQAIWKKIIPYAHVKKKVIQRMLNDIEQVYDHTATHGKCISIGEQS